MPGSGKVKAAIIGSQFEADIHAASFRIMPEEAEVVAGQRRDARDQREGGERLPSLRVPQGLVAVDPGHL